MLKPFYRTAPKKAVTNNEEVLLYCVKQKTLSAEHSINQVTFFFKYPYIMYLCFNYTAPPSYAM